MASAPKAAQKSFPLRKTLIFSLSAAALAGAGWGAHNAMRSPMFTLQVIEIADLPENAPVDAQTVQSLAAVPVGAVNLFDLDLKPVEDRVLTHPWIREVKLEKHFPQTLSISLVFREPQALMQADNGALSYVDIDGHAFGQVNLMVQPDLPVISPSASGHAVEALQLIHGWDQSEVARAAQISQIQWDAERGFRALVSYPLEAAHGGAAAPVHPAALTRGRTFVDFGQDLDATAAKAQFERLSRVFSYLSTNRVQARQIWADAGKKIVVKTAHGS